MSALNDDGSQRSVRSARTKNKLRHLGETVIASPFTDGTGLYLVIVLVGGAAATWFIPFINLSETSAETLGIYVIGILVAVFADALFLWKSGKDDAIASPILGASFLLAWVVGFLAVKEHFQLPDGTLGRRWPSYSYPLIALILLVSIVLWAMINVVEPRLDVAATQDPPDYSHLSGS